MTATIVAAVIAGAVLAVIVYETTEWLKDRSRNRRIEELNR
jgi:uncharacterized protein (DUF2062 family)